ncbi:gamma-aminobutyric acid type B receptor subunit 2-like [Antedon mediterranea]|uniref:gamma-aminobutyric acid type B receptor subunit 2-like n=1 Tax=Antedon mediterranea TaxID=105859 RepID=UPI003AF448BF
MISLWISTVLSLTLLYRIEASDDKVLYFAGLSPFSGSMEGVGNGILPAVELALEHIKKSKALLNGYELRAIWNDTECDMAIGMRSFFESMASSPTKFMVFGGVCPEVTSPIAESIHLWNIPQLSFADTTPSLSQQDKYPYFYRTVPSESADNVARIRLIKYFNWTSIGTIHQDVSRFSYAQDQLDKEAERNGVNITISASFSDDTKSAIMELKKSHARILVGFFDEVYARNFFCQVFKEGLSDRNYVWILPGWYSDKWWRPTKQIQCTEQEMIKTINGYIATDILPLSSSPELTISGLTASEYQKLYEKVRGNNYSRFHGYAYDGVWVMAQVLDKVIDSMELNEIETLQTFKYDDEDLLLRIARALNETKFTGVTGEVYFTAGERIGSQIIRQFQDGRMVKIGEYHSLLKHLDITNDAFRWSGNIPPPYKQLSESSTMQISKSLFFTMVGIATLGILAACCFLVFNMKHRKQRYIKMSSPNINNLIIVGGILAYSCVFLLGLDKAFLSTSEFRVVCVARAWFLCVSFTLAFGAMFCKTWRVYRIFTNVKMKKKVIKDGHLIIMVAVMLVIDAIVLIAWQLLDPMHVAKQYLEPKVEEGRDVLIEPIAYACVSNFKNVWLSILYVYKGALMTFGCLLAWSTRHVSIPALNDSKYIGMCVYNVMLLCVCGAALMFMIENSPNAAFGIISAFIIFCSSLTLGLVFVPKIIELQKNPNANDRVRAVIRSERTPLHSVNDNGKKIEKLTSENSSAEKRLQQCEVEIERLEQKVSALEIDVIPQRDNKNQLPYQHQNVKSEYSDKLTSLATTHSEKVSPLPITVCVEEPTICSISDHGNSNEYLTAQSYIMAVGLHSNDKIVETLGRRCITKTNTIQLDYSLKSAEESTSECDVMISKKNEINTLSKGVLYRSDIAIHSLPVSDSFMDRLQETDILTDSEISCSSLFNNDA